MPNIPRREIRSHHSIRGIAALLVLIFHLLEILAWGELDLNSKVPFLTKSYLWVDCFFILSGFVLSYAYAKSLHINEPSKFRESTACFLRARFARIYPLHIFTLFLMLLIRTSSYLVFPQTDPFFRSNNDLYSLITNIFLVQSWELNDSLTWNNPSWSISTETFAYLLFPLLCAAQFIVPKFFRSILFVVPIFGYAILLFLDGNLNQTYHLSLLRCVAGFTLGMATYNIWKAFDIALLNRLYKLQIIIVLGIISAMHFGLSDIFPVALFFLLILTTADDKGPVATILCRPTLVHLGMISYSVYMNHFVIIHFVHQYKWFFFDYWVSAGIIDATLLSVIVFFMIIGIVLAFSVFTYRFVEVPARRYLQRRRPRSTTSFALEESS